MDDVFADILDRCLAQLEAGASVDECLAAYPHQRGDLESSLLMAAALIQLPRPSMPATTRAALESQVLARAAARRAAQPPTRPSVPPQAATRPTSWTLRSTAVLAGFLRAVGYRGSLAQPWQRLAAAALALVLALVLGVGAFAAARAIIEEVAPRRPTAVPTVVPTALLRLSDAFTLDGAVEQINQEGWVVKGTPVAIDARTVINGTPAIGAAAHIDGVILADRTLLARTITVGAPLGTPPPAGTPVGSPVPTLTPTPFVSPTLMPSPISSPTVVPPAVSPKDDEGGDAEKGDKERRCKGKDKQKCDPKDHDEQ